MNAKITWFEFLGKDAETLRTFYAELFGWRLQMVDTEVGPYAFTDPEQTGVPGGVGPVPMGPGWTTVYVGVDDLEAAVARAEAHGGRVLMPITQLPNGHIAVVADPEGHAMGLSQFNDR